MEEDQEQESFEIDEVDMWLHLSDSIDGFTYESQAILVII